ncbi:MAG: hypothetical protein M0P33_04735 [Massilibacteroides sp.]|nr:hypothetical protein [Massilibacteroides sp.]
MKRLGIFLMALLLSSALQGIKAQEQIIITPINVNVEQLAKYLDLESWQKEELVDINYYFVDKQLESYDVEIDKRKEKMHEAIFSNLKLIRDVFTEGQYRKYVEVLNVTYNNNQLLNTDLSDVYLAYN